MEGDIRNLDCFPFPLSFFPFPWVKPSLPFFLSSRAMTKAGAIGNNLYILILYVLFFSFSFYAPFFLLSPFFFFFFLYSLSGQLSARVRQGDVRRKE